MICKLCASNKTTHLFTSANVHGRFILGNEQFGIYECGQCKVVFVDVNTGNGYYQKYYSDDYYYPDEPSKSLLSRFLFFLEGVSFRHKLRLIEKYKPVGRKILEIGCARGKFLRYLPDYFEKHGVEINEKACRYIKETDKSITVYNVKLDGQFDSNGVKYDVIVMWHVFEHIDNPQDFLKNVVKLLAREGVFIFQIPNRDSFGFNFTRESWFLLDTPRHLFHYNRESMTSLLKNHNLEIIECSVGSVSDCFQSLALSFYNKLMAKQNLVATTVAYLIFPFTVIIQAVLCWWAARSAEVNTYVVKHGMDEKAAI